MTTKKKIKTPTKKVKVKTIKKEISFTTVKNVLMFYATSANYDNHPYDNGYYPPIQKDRGNKARNLLRQFGYQQ